jgi:cytochrome P450
VELNGVLFRKGDNVILWMPLSNLDERVFDHPLDVNIDRAPSAPIAFGADPHRCIGSNIARQQVRITYEEWLKRIPHSRIPQRARYTRLPVERWYFPHSRFAGIPQCNSRWISSVLPRDSCGVHTAPSSERCPTRSPIATVKAVN